jgi:hypothetical protein
MATMLTAVEGVFRDGHIELREIPENIREARVIVTFLPVAAPADRGGAAPPEAAERIRALRAFVDALPDAPTVPLEALDREKLYP